MARKAHKVTDEMRRQVETLSGYGLTKEQVAPALSISKSTLEKYYSAELVNGRAKALAKVAQTAYQMATSGDNTAMTIFVLKTQAGWRETQHIDINQTVKNIDADDKTIERMALEVLEGGKAKKKKA